MPNIEISAEQARRLARGENITIKPEVKDYHGFKVGDHVIVKTAGYGNGRGGQREAYTCGVVTEPNGSSYYGDSSRYVWVHLDGDASNGGWGPESVKPNPFHRQ